MDFEISFKSSLEDMLIGFRERERQTDKEKCLCVRETSIDCLPYTPQPEPNLQYFRELDDAPTNLATWPGQKHFYLNIPLTILAAHTLLICVQ